MSKILTLSAFVIALVMFGAPLAQAQDSPNNVPSDIGLAPQSLVPRAPAPGSCPGQQLLLNNFLAGDAYIINLTPTANGKISVLTADGGIFGPDIWRVALYEVKPNGAGKSKSGDGTLDVFTGKVSLGGKLGRNYKVIVSPDSIPGGFPAGLFVCITGPVIIVGPLAE